MKRIILIWIVSLLSIQAFSQSIKSEVLDFERIGDIYTQKTVINFGDTYILSQNGTNSEIYNVNSSQVAVLPSTLYVKDFVVYGSEIFFCGTTSGIGFIARADLNYFFNNNIYSMIYVADARSLDKMLLDTYSGTYNIACVGIDNFGVSIFLHCRLNTRMYEIYKSPNQNEIFDDLIIHGQEILIVGRDSNNPADFIVIGYDRYSYYSTFRNRYNNGTGWEYTNRLLASPLDGSSIAIVGEGEDNGTNLITIASFVDLSNFNPPFTKCFGSERYIGNQGEFARVKDILFSSADNKLLILEEYPYSFTNPSPFTELITSVMLLEIVQTLTNRDAIYSNINGFDHKYNSLVEKDPYVFLATGINPSTGEVEIWEGDRSFLGGNCNLIDSYDLNEENINLFQLYPFLYLDNLYYYEYNPGTNNVISVNKNIICK